MALIEIRNLSKTFGSVKAVDGVDLDINPGEFITLLGPSGSGKTTVLRMIAGFEDPDSGSIKLNGEEITHLPPYDRDVNTVFQDYALFPHMDVITNIEYGLRVKKVPKDERREKANAALAQVRLSGYESRKPSQLSGGQRQRIGIARALYHDPQVLVLDEATSSLDTETERGVMESVRKLLGSKTILIIAHRVSTVGYCNTVYRFEGGRVVGSGSPDVMTGTGESAQS